MEQIILIVHVLVAIAIIGLILLQQGKGADMGASFGAGASQTLFGSGGSGNALTKGTAILATLFFVTSFGLALVAKNSALSSGDVDIPSPAVVETATDEGAAVDIPEEALEAIQEGNLDIPEASVSGASDIPSASDQSAAGGVESDIPQ